MEISLVLERVVILVFRADRVKIWYLGGELHDVFGSNSQTTPLWQAGEGLCRRLWPSDNQALAKGLGSLLKIEFEAPAERQKEDKREGSPGDAKKSGQSPKTLLPKCLAESGYF